MGAVVIATPPMAAREAIPIPCRRCGASMRELPATNLTGEVVARCPMCGNTEPLPSDAAARVHALRARLVELRAAKSAAEAPVLAVASMSAHLRSFQVVGLAVFMLATWATQNVGPMARAIDRARGRPLVDALAQLAPDVATSMIVPAVLVGFAVGYVWMLAFFKSALRPALLARAPHVVGAPARCRSCGGDLPASTAASTTCAFCGATNFLGPELTASRDALLAAEAAEQRALAQGFGQRLGDVARPSRRFYAGLALGAVATMALGLAIAVGLALFG